MKLGEIDVLSQCCSKNYWDSVSVPMLRQERNARLFGNANIGYQYLTNLQVPGQFSYDDSPLLIQRWYARTNLVEEPALMSALRHWAESVQACLVIGDVPRWRLPLSDLLLRRPFASEQARLLDGDPWPIVLHQRQVFRVTLDAFIDADVQPLITELANCGYATEPYLQNQGLIWIHFEGLNPPSENKVWDVESLLDIVIAEGKKRRTTEEKIANWVLGVARREGGNVQLEAIADAILDGRASGEQLAPYPKLTQEQLDR